ncbi:MAG: hypothetical protein JSC161_000883 [Candidatus Tokpelaia sp. JSC161]|nr:MAG: hypothetical protein JSC161_000883 [Candidatus Tokpelaia sp. JSC161]
MMGKMVTEIRVPALGEAVSQAVVSKWYKKNGDFLNLDEPLLELETDKVTIDVPVSASGQLSEVLVKEGETVEIGDLVALITTEEDHLKSKSEWNEVGPPTPTPSARKLIAENHLLIDKVKGSGKRGQILKEDVVNTLSRQHNSSVLKSAFPSVKAGERVRMSRLRRTIASRLKNAQNTAAILTTFNEVDMTAVITLRKRYRDVFEKKHGIKLGFMGFFTKAVCCALKEVPALNTEIDGDDVLYKNYAHIGIAVSTEKGLVVPVVRDADRLSIVEIEKEIGRLAQSARDGRLSFSDMQDGSFTITNGGKYGSLMSTPILNMPQSGILGMHAIRERPIAINGQVVIRQMMYLAVSYDHRIVDGQEAVTFLVRVKESLEYPERFIFDI